MTKFVATTAFALCLGTAAFAQSGTTSGSSTSATSNGGATGSSGGDARTSTQMPSGWSGAIANAFFNGSTPRPENEIKQNWASLTAQQKAQVKTDCQKSNTETDAYSRTGQRDTETTGSESTTGSGSTGRDGDETTANTATGNRAGGPAVGIGQQIASIRQVCGIIEGM